MRSEADVREVFRLAALGLSQAAIARATDVSRTQVRAWLTVGQDDVLSSPMRAKRWHADQTCALVEAVPHLAYAYLLGQYLGDGHISVMPNGVDRLRITTCDAYPDIRAECEAAIAAVMPGRKVSRQHSIGCTNVCGYSRHWTCLFPQHGPGPKHERRIILEPWQEKIALVEHPDLFLRGLIHSDGWRGTNRVRGANGMPYAYPRYQFSNRSDDIKALFIEACERLGVEARQMNRAAISVAKRASVSLLDQYIGVKS